MKAYTYKHKRTGEEITIKTDGGLVSAARGLTKVAGKHSLEYELVDETNA